MKFKENLLEKLGQFKYRFIAIGVPILIYIIITVISVTSLKFSGIINDVSILVIIGLIIDMVWLTIGFGLILWRDHVVRMTIFEYTLNKIKKDAIQYNRDLEEFKKQQNEKD